MTTEPAGYSTAEYTTGQLSRRLLGLVWQHRWGCLRAMALQVLMLGLALGGLNLTGVAVDAIRFFLSHTGTPPHWPLGIVPPPGMAPLRVLAALAAGLFAVALVRAVLNYAFAIEVAKLLQGRIVVQLRSAVYEKMQSLSFRFFDANASGSLINRVTGDVQSTRLFVDGVIMQGLTLALSLVFYLVYMIRIHPLLTLACLGTTPLIWVLTAAFSRRMRPAYRRNRELSDQMILSFSETVQGIPVVKGFAREEAMLEKFSAASAAVRDHRYGIVRRVTRFIPQVGFLSQANLAVVLGYGGLLVIRGELPLGTGLVVFAGLLQQFSGQISNIGAIANSLQESLTAARRVFEVLDAPEGVSSPAHPVPLGRVRGDVSIEDVWFEYDPGEPVLRGVTLRAQPGQCVAILGATASGKSTLLSLLPRFHDPVRGRVMIDGRDLRTVPLRELRRQIGVVFQESFLFSNTIAANIAFGNPEASRAEIERAAGLAGAHEFISVLPQGYDTVLEEGGANLSGGQRQRLAIARALLLDPALLILDDPTASVDAHTEDGILQALKGGMRGRTTLLVTHRLSALRQADRIAVLERGRIVQEGTHDALMAVRGPYRRLALLQGFEEDGAPLRAPSPEGEHVA